MPGIVFFWPAAKGLGLYFQTLPKCFGPTMKTQDDGEELAAGVNSID